MCWCVLYTLLYTGMVFVYPGWTPNRERLGMEFTKCANDYEMPYAPPMGKEEEQKLSVQLKLARDRAMDDDGNLHVGDKYSKDVANYLNIRSEFVMRFAFVITKETKRLVNQLKKITIDDLYNSGWEALMAAADKHDFRTNTRFISFASTAVRNAMHRCLDDHNRTVRIPTSKIEQIFIKGSGKPIEELSTISNLDTQTILSITEPTISIDTPINENEAILHTLICVEREDGTSRRREYLVKAIECLDGRCKDVLIDHFINGMALNEISKKNGWCKQRSRNLINSGINRLKKNKDAMEYLDKANNIDTCDMEE